MNDPRTILNDELIKIGILNSDAIIIALDAGSSQVIVNMEYLNDFNYPLKVRKLANKLVSKFYTGELFEDEI